MQTIPGTRVQSRYAQDQRVTDQLDGTFLVDTPAGRFRVCYDVEGWWDVFPLGANRDNALDVGGTADDAISRLIGEPA